MEHAYGEITAYSESQELIITLCVLLEPEETTCTTRTNPNYVQEEITDSACPGGMWYYFYIRA